jgi:hypothetical protein
MLQLQNALFSGAQKPLRVLTVKEGSAGDGHQRRTLRARTCRRKVLVLTE